MKKGTKIAIFGVSVVLLIATIFLGIKYDQKQIKAIDNDIALTNQYLMIIEKQENVVFKLDDYWLSNDERGKSFVFIFLTLVDEKKEIEDYRSILEKKKASFLTRYAKIFKSLLNYQYYYAILSLQNRGLFEATQNSALIMTENIVKNKKLLNDPLIKEAIDNIIEAARILEGAKADLEELDLILKDRLPT